MLTDDEADEIDRRRRAGVSGGPIVLSWVDRLLADRRERMRQIRHLQQRLRQAFRYLDGLMAALAESRRERWTAIKSPPRPLTCPACRQVYVRAYGVSPAGIAYIHEDGRECRQG